MAGLNRPLQKFYRFTLACSRAVLWGGIESAQLDERVSVRVLRGTLTQWKKVPYLWMRSSEVTVIAGAMMSVAVCV